MYLRHSWCSFSCSFELLFVLPAFAIFAETVAQSFYIVPRRHLKTVVQGNGLNGGIGQNHFAMRNGLPHLQRPVQPGLRRIAQSMDGAYDGCRVFDALRWQDCNGSVLLVHRELGLGWGAGRGHAETSKGCV